MILENILQVEFVILFLGTAYAWYNWYLVLVGRCETCSVSVHDKPFTSKCFVGAIFFTLALVVNVVALYLI